MSRVHPTADAARPSDPLALFAALADEAPGLGSAADADEMRRAVAAMRRARRLVGPGRRLPAVDWQRAAAVGVLTAGMLSLAAGGWLRTAEGRVAAAGGQPAGVFGAEVLGPEVYGPGVYGPVAAGGDAGETADERARRPVFEGLDQPRTASVYELAGEDLDLVMVVDETLDV